MIDRGPTITITPGQALMLLIEQYPNDRAELMALYLSGAKDTNSKKAIDDWLNPESHPILRGYVISTNPVHINEDPTRRFFETHLAKETLSRALKEINIELLQKNFEALCKLIPEKVMSTVYGLIIKNVLEGTCKVTGNELYDQFNDFIKKINSGAIYENFTRVSNPALKSETLDKEDQSKMLLIAKNTFLMWFLGSQIYTNQTDNIRANEYLSTQGRGRVKKEGRSKVGSLHLGIFKSYMPLFRNDDAYIDIPQHNIPYTNLSRDKVDMSSHENVYFPNVKGPDLYNFNEDAKWPKDNFEHLVHPFCCSISGTMGLCLNMFKILNDNNQLQFNDAAKLSNYLKCYTSLSLFQLGVHSYHEFFSTLAVNEIKKEFEFMQGFTDINLESTLLKGNEEAFNIAINQTISYNKKIIQKTVFHQDLLLFFRKKPINDNELTLEKYYQQITEYCYANKIPTGVVLEIKDAFAKYIETAAIDPPSEAIGVIFVQKYLSRIKKLAAQRMKETFVEGLRSETIKAELVPQQISMQEKPAVKRGSPDFLEEDHDVKHRKKGPVIL